MRNGKPYHYPKPAKPVVPSHTISQITPIVRCSVQRDAATMHIVHAPKLGLQPWAMAIDQDCSACFTLHGEEI